MRVAFFGAAQNVTGARIVLESNGSRILIDCGLYQEHNLKYRNWQRFPINPASIDAVLITHAHVDHCGYLPKLVKDGFSGPIYCTPPTEAIAKIALLDAAKLQEHDAEHKRERHERQGKKKDIPVEPLFTTEDAERVFPLFKSIRYKKGVAVTQNIKAHFYDAGHILGAAMIRVQVKENGKTKRFVFSGDIGRRNKVVLCDPTVFRRANYVFMEATYGNRVHEEGESIEGQLEKVILETIKAGGNLVVPTFAIERAQEFLYCIANLLREKKIPPIVVFIDSPMAIDVTKVFNKYARYFDKETAALFKHGKSPFSFPLLKSVRSVEESKSINNIKGTSIILAGSGMCTGGRIKYHLVNNISRPESTILFIGYQAKGTLGRELFRQPERVRILGETHEVRARIEKLNGFSSHADKPGLLQWVKSFFRAPEKIFIMHSEAEAAVEFGETLHNETPSEIVIPEHEEWYEL